MWHFEQTPTWHQTDTTQFVDMVNTHSSFWEEKPLYVGRAPGRLDLMGGIADYSGSLVLELPLAVATYVAAQITPEQVFQVFSPGLETSDSGEEPLVTLPLALLEKIAAGSAEALTRKAGTDWVSYLAGVWLMLHRTYTLPLHHGVRLLVYSQVPAGKGVSSSAALEVATLQALAGLYGLEISGTQAAVLCQQAENKIVGAPCGIMDQMTVACGQADHLLALRCQPAELEGNLKLPAELTVWGIDSGIRHAVTGADYGTVRVGAFMGYRLIAEQAELKTEQLGGQLVKIEDPIWHGYLANLRPSVWESTFQANIPEQLSGAEFLSKWGGTTDAVTQVNPAQVYPVRQATAHPIYENHRVQLFRALLLHADENETLALKEERLALLGELMYQSHQSYTRCGLGSSGTDRLVELVRQAGPTAGLYGAKITGGGSGGTVAVLGHREATSTIQQIAARYTEETGYTPLILSGSSPGAVSFGSLRLV